MEQDLVTISLQIQRGVNHAANVMAAELNVSKAELMRRAFYHYIGFLAGQKDGPEAAKRESTQKAIPPTGKYRSTSLELPADQSELAKIAERTLAAIGGKEWDGKS